MSVELLAQRYRLAEQIGQGGMGRVWRATDELLNRPVAIKEMRVAASLDDPTREELIQRTMREARICAGVVHPSAVTIHDVVLERNRPWIVMEYVQGRSLERIVAEDGPLTPGRTAAIGRQLVSALRSAHDAGTLHRDVKPANVLVTDSGRAVLTDFGIAVSDAENKLTLTGRIPGAPGYIAPERLQGGETTAASDMWSLGATLYFAVEGRPVFDGATPAARLTAPLREDPPPPRHAGPLRPVLLGMLQRDPMLRPNDAELEATLDRVSKGIDDTGEHSPTALDVSGMAGDLPPPGATPRPGPGTGPQHAMLHPGLPRPPVGTAASAGHGSTMSWRRITVIVVGGLITLILAPLLVEYLATRFF